MTTAFEVPLAGIAEEFYISGGGTVYFARVTWNGPSNSWTLDIYDGDQKPLATGLPMITGTDLLCQLEYVGLGGALIVQTDSDSDRVPDYDSLGITGHLFYVTNP